MCLFWQRNNVHESTQSVFFFSCVLATSTSKTQRISHNSLRQFVDVVQMSFDSFPFCESMNRVCVRTHRAASLLSLLLSLSAGAWCVFLYSLWHCSTSSANCFEAERQGSRRETAENVRHQLPKRETRLLKTRVQ